MRQTKKCIQKKIGDKQDLGNPQTSKKPFLIAAFFSIILLLASVIYGNPGAYSIESPITCTDNCSGGYEIYNNTPEYCDANPIECFNTIDSCMDGSVTIDGIRQSSPYEWVENITITSLNSTNFTGGGIVEIKAFFECDADVDEMAFAYNNGSGWRSIHYLPLNSKLECFIEGQKAEVTYNATLDDIRGNHSIRAIIAYDGNAAMTCGHDYDSMYSDTDDITFFVNSDYETSAPSVTSIAPEQGQAYEFILPKTITISAEVSDDNAVDSVIANITWDAFQQSVSLENTQNNTWQGDFSGANITGQYNITIIANDTNGNINSTEKTYFIIQKTTNISLHSPINEEWYPEFLILLDYSIEPSAGDVNWTGYMLNGGPLVNVTTPLALTNNISATPQKYVNNTGVQNISQSFTTSANMTLKSIQLAVKREGNPANITLQIRDDNSDSPGNNILSEINYSETLPNTTIEWVEMIFASPVSLNSSQKYWILIAQNTSGENCTLFETNEGAYSGGVLSSNNSQDLLFILTDKYRYTANITLTEETNNITTYANATASAALLSSPSTVFYVDRKGPGISNIAYAPQAQANIDPQNELNITARITDASNISSVILQYKLSNEIEWNSTPMSNTSETDYLGSFTPASEGSWVIRIYANDTLSNVNYSQNSTISVEYERTYTVNTTNFNESAGIFINTNSSLGEIILKNTGDNDINFSVAKSTSTIPSVYINNETTLNFTLAKNEERTLQIKATALGIESQSDISIIITSTDDRNTQANYSVNATIISFVSGPYFLVTITSYDSSVTLGDQRTQLSGEITNMGNESAGNITIYWTLPEGWTPKENITKNVTTLGVGQKEFYDISASISQTAPTGTFSIILTAENNLTNNSDSRTVTVSSGIVQSPATGGSSKTNTVTNTVTSIVEIGNPQIKISAPETIEALRGKNTTFQIRITNEEQKNISGLTFAIQSQDFPRAKITPKTSPLAAGSQITLDATLEIPLYLEETKYPIAINVTLPWGGRKIYFEKSVTVIVLGANISEFASCIIETESEITALKSQGFNTAQLETLLRDAKSSLASKDYTDSMEKCEMAKAMASDAKEAANNLKELSSEKLLYTSGSFQSALGLANEAFSKGEFILAKQRAKDAALILQIDKQSLMYNAKKVFSGAIENWPLTLAGFAISAIIMFFAYSRLSISYSKRKLESLKYDEKAILELIKKVQTHHFAERAISKRVYEKHMESYRKKIASLQDEKNKLRLRILNLKGESKKQTIASQAELINYFKKELQEEFFVKRIIDRKSYDNMMSEYDKLLSDMGEEAGMMQVDEN